MTFSCELVSAAMHVGISPMELVAVVHLPWPPPSSYELAYPLEDKDWVHVPVYHREEV